MINLKQQLQEYIKNNLVNDIPFKYSKRREVSYEKSRFCEDRYGTNISDFVEQINNYSNFQTLLFKMIDDRNLKDSDVYNKVHIDRRLFSKIRNEQYHPSKETIILLGISLELNEKEIEELLNSASYSLPKNNYYDLIIRFCFVNKIYNLVEVNELLNEYNCKLFNY